MTDLAIADTPGLSPDGHDGFGYEWRRELLLEQETEPPVITGTLYDQQGRMIQISAHNGNVTVFMPAGRCTLPPGRAGDFAQSYARACREASAQAAASTVSERNEPR